jgi:uncharacterized tellurite resistance protein B-like protein
MFERLLKRIGQSNQSHLKNIATDAELLLAAAKVLFAVLPVDHVVTKQEGVALRTSLIRLFALSPEKCRRLMARAAAAHGRESSILAAATLLKHRTPEAFRHELLEEVNSLIHADGVLHDNELDLEQRVARLLGLDNGGWKQTA